MLVEPGQTNYDLRFRLFGTPVRVHPFFWLFTAILGWNALSDPGGDGFMHLCLWMICCFLSILLHEFGHIWMGTIFGARDGYIVLYGLGGLAVGSNALRTRWQRIAVSLAGPGIQLVLFGGLFLALRSLSREQLDAMSSRLEFFFEQLLFINLIWPLFNLLPVWPLDGGMVSREVCSGLAPRGGLRFSLGLSIAVAGFIAVHALLSKARGGFAIPYLPTSTYAAILFGLLALQSYQLLQQVPSWRYEPPDDRLPWESDSEAWKK
jgi:stage IV sporulation protein FB